MPPLNSSALSEEDLIDDADLDTLVREAIAQVSFKPSLHAAIRVFILSWRYIQPACKRSHGST
jgi:hypothetical protein